MTDMHREAFERRFDAEHAEHTQQTDGGKGYVQMLKSRAWKVWQAALSYRDEQDQTSVWRCYKEYMSGGGGRVHSEKFAKTKADMLIFKSQGYDCEKLSDEQEKQA